MTSSTITENPTTTPTRSLAALIEARQSEQSLTNRQLSDALGFDREIVLILIKQGTMKLPLNKIPALATALSLEPTEVLRIALAESSSELLAVIEDVFSPMHLTTAETNLIRHLRTLAGDQPCAPIVFEGKAIIALVTA